MKLLFEGVSMQRYLTFATVVAMAAISAPASAGFFNKKCCSTSYTDCCGSSWHSGASAGGCCDGSGGAIAGSPVAAAPAPAPAAAPATRTILVPEMVWETRQVKSMESVPVTKDVQVTVTKNVMVDEVRTHNVTEYQKVQKTRTCNVTVCKTVQVQEPRTCTTYQKSTVQKQGVRTVCRKVPCTEYKTVTKDCGHWENQCVQTGCKTRKGPCGECETVPVFKNKRVWVPNCVTTTVPCTTYKTESVQEPYTYCETVCTPVTKTEMVTVCKQVSSVEPRTETYFECVPVTKAVTCTVKVCKPVSSIETRKCTTYECREVVKECKVQVCRMVEKVVACAPACDPCATPCCDPCATSCCKKSFFNFGGGFNFFKKGSKGDCGCNSGCSSCGCGG